MNGYGSNGWNRSSDALSTSQKATTTVCPTMNLGVPKKRAKRSAARPKRSPPKAPRMCSGIRDCSTATPSTAAAQIPLVKPPLAPAGYGGEDRDLVPVLDRRLEA